MVHNNQKLFDSTSIQIQYFFSLIYLIELTIIVENQYVINNKTIIFYPEYNQIIDNHILSDLNTIIFSNYDKNKKYIGSKFNQSVESLPNSITDLTFGFSFNQLVESLPNFITSLTFSYYFN